MVRENHQLNGREFEQTPGDRGGQRAWYAAAHEVTYNLVSQTQLSD